ncbi:lytic transglycosylase domain-containing protein [Caballeronia sp. LZ033]|uniref:lytic transglycosylase domain-containing protein n=1 Tax=Caballeronia sp. LZ033 TaxID=3038566 RepID=UPI002864EF6D|nr:lytic transglycosylase domain-containing protein [Caballeronia sp. LZ033]MDR5813315.1 lytic transglycosylase domain-containing protein [Caballeronia sp. LZ033]
MANQFQIVISAVDNATATVRKVNNSFATLMAPVTDLGKSLSAFGKETGIEKIGKSLVSLGRTAVDTARSILTIHPALAALLSVGSVASIAALATGWGRAGQEIARTSALVGVSAADLQAYRGAAKLAGLSSEDMSAGLQSLGDTFQGAMFGRAPEALAIMSAYGVSMHKLKDGSVDTTRALADVATMIQRNFAGGGNIEGARKIAQAFGVESLLPMLMKGPEYIRKMVDEAQKIGFVMGPEQIKNAEEYAKNISMMDLAVDGLKNSVGNALIPVLQPLIVELSSWISQNRELIATDVSGFVRDLSNYLRGIDWKAISGGVEKFIDNANTAAQAVGGWKVVLIGLAGIKLAGIIADVYSLAAGITKLTFAANALTGGVLFKTLGALGLLFHSEDLNKGEEARLADIRQREKQFTDAGIDPSTYDFNGSVNRGGRGAPDEQPGTIMEVPADDGMSIEEIPAGVVGADSTTLFAALERKEGLKPGTLDKYWLTESSRGKRMRGPVTKSGERAQGHFQFMKATAQQYGVSNPDDLADAAAGAARMLHHLYGKYGDDDRRVAAAYNWGEGNVDRLGLGAAPAETQAYMDKIAPSIYGARAPAAVADAGANGAVANGAVAGGGTVKVDINLRGAPRGTTTQVSSSGNVEPRVGAREAAGGVL